MRLILLLIPVLLSAQAIRRTTAGSSDYPVRAVRSEPKVVWEAKPGFRDFGPMVVSSGVVVTGNTTGTGGIFAFDAATGRKLWSLPGQMKGGPAADAKAAYAVSNLGSARYQLNALDLKTGRKLWAAAGADLGAFDTAPLPADGKVFLVSANGTVQAYDASSGQLAWEQRYAPDKGRCPTALAAANGIVYFGGGDAQYGGSQGRYLWALEAATGRTVWRYQAMPETYSRDGACVSAPGLGNGLVAVTSERALFVLDAGTGKLRWRADHPQRQPLASPVIAAGTVYAAARDGIFGWDLSSGRLVFEFPIVLPLDAGAYEMAAASGVLYFIGGDGFLTGLDLKTRQILWKHRVSRPSQFASEESWKTRYILPGDGVIYYENIRMLAKIQ